MKFWISVFFLLLSSFANSQQFYQKAPKAVHWVDSVFASLSKQQRIAQLMVIRESGINNGKTVSYDKEVENAIRKYNIGSICLFQGNPVEQARYLNYFQSIAQTPLMVCIDGETGLGMRMTDSVMKFPFQLTMGAVADPDLIFRIGQAIGSQCVRMGIQVNYAPVVDINNDPRNPVIGSRSFGEDKDRVALLGTKMMLGIQSRQVMACAKHFPGHGDVSVDSHLDLPLINKSMNELNETELYPFKVLFNAGVGSVMIAHLSIPAIDNTPHLPTSLSKKNVTGLLRNDLDFHGISFTDALEMKGVTKYFQSGEAAVRSLIAGNDMLCLPGDVDTTMQAILTAIKKGRLKQKDIDRRVKKVLLAKYHLGLSNPPVVLEESLTLDLNKEVVSLRSEVAKSSLTVLSLSDSNMIPLGVKKRIAYVAIGENQMNTLGALLLERENAALFYFDYTKNEDDAKKLLDSLKQTFDLVVIGVHNYSRFPANNFGISEAAARLSNAIQLQQKAITILFGNPYGTRNFCESKNLVVAYEGDSVFQKSAFDWLKGYLPAVGRLPVTVCEKYPVGSGIKTNAAMLPLVMPEDAGLNSSILNRIDSIAEEAITHHATPGCVVYIAKDGKTVFNRAYGYMSYDSLQPVSTATVYDLASVTKTSATTVSVMKLVDEGKIDLNKTLGDYLDWVRGTDKDSLRLIDIMLHQAGMVAYIPFYKETIDVHTGRPLSAFYRSKPDADFNVTVAKDLYLRNDYVDTMYSRILKSWLIKPQTYVYSDNDFIFMGKIVEAVSGKRLDVYAAENFYQPLEMTSTCFKPLEKMNVTAIAPTENEPFFRMQLLRGYVHDPGAAMFGGVAGHAGLFSNASDLARLYQMLLNNGTYNGKRYIDSATIRRFTSYQSNISRRGIGFDKPHKSNIMHEEPYPAKSVSPATFGHTGFTGTCVWVDPIYNIVYIFLSNRVNPDGGSNNKLSQMNIRSAIQETIYEAMIR